MNRNDEEFQWQHVIENNCNKTITIKTITTITIKIIAIITITIKTIATKRLIFYRFISSDKDVKTLKTFSSETFAPRNGFKQNKTRSTNLYYFDGRIEEFIEYGEVFHLKGRDLSPLELGVETTCPSRYLECCRGLNEFQFFFAVFVARRFS